MRQQHRWKLSTVVSAFLCAACLGFSPAGAAERPHGLEPADDMPYMPDLGGLRVKTFKNQYGQVRHLAEGVVMRHSAVADGKATVPAGGFYYISETQEDAAPFMRDPFLILGEHAYLVDLTTEQREVRNVSIERREKKLVDEVSVTNSRTVVYRNISILRIVWVHPACADFPVRALAAGIHGVQPLYPHRQNF